MKKTAPLAIIALFFILTASKCKKDPVNNPIDQLPAATQTGANTFGCLVNGQAFLPRNAALGVSALQSNYQYLGNGVGGGYFFRLVATNGSGNNLTSLGLFTDSLPINQGGIFNLDTLYIPGKSFGLYTGLGNSVQDWNYSTKRPKYTGQLLITHLDSANQIVCGTFWFNAANSNGDTVKITDGRFDVKYTR